MARSSCSVLTTLSDAFAALPSDLEKSVKLLMDSLVELLESAGLLMAGARKENDRRARFEVNVLTRRARSNCFLAVSYVEAVQDVAASATETGVFQRVISEIQETGEVSALDGWLFIVCDGLQRVQERLKRFKEHSHELQDMAAHQRQWFQNMATKEKTTRSIVRGGVTAVGAVGTALRIGGFVIRFAAAAALGLAGSGCSDCSDCRKLGSS